MRRSFFTTLIRAALISILACCSAAVTFAQQPSKYALLCAVTKYSHAEMNRNAIDYPEIDARSVGELLEKYGYKVDYLLGRQATKKNIEAKLSALGSVGDSDGALLVGFWGHGVEYADVGEAMFCPYDATVRVAKDADGKTLFEGATKRELLEPDPKSLVGMATILSGMRLSGAGNRLLLADCCRESPNKARGRAFGTNVSIADLPDNTLALFACKANEQAFEHSSWGHGAMTKVLLELLPNYAGEEQLAVGIIAPLSTSVSRLVSNLNNGRDRQTIHPILNGNPQLKLENLSSPQPASFINSVGSTMKLITAGTFMMGSPDSDNEAEDDEKPQHRVTLSRSFYMGETEVTQGQWKAVMGTEPWKGEEYVKEGDNYPATHVSWEDAVEFCKKLSAKEGKQYRLPTEAEWEYACRGGKSTKYSFGDDAAILGRYAWFEDNADKIGEEYAHEVKQKLPNAFGLYDMHGNVREWCSDDKREYGVGAATNPEGPTDGKFRVLRGGWWGDAARLCRSADRHGFTPSLRFSSLGFRLVSVSQ